jgi:hypothetical protein
VDDEEVGTTVIPPYLMLGNGRYLSIAGQVETSNLSAEDIASYTMFDPEFDAESEGAPGPVQRLSEANLEFWEAAAARGGHTLESLRSE